MMTRQQSTIRSRASFFRAGASGGISPSTTKVSCGSAGWVASNRIST